MENEENEKFYVFFSHTAEPSTGNAGCCPCTLSMHPLCLSFPTPEDLSLALHPSTAVLHHQANMSQEMRATMSPSMPSSPICVCSEPSPPLAGPSAYFQQGKFPGGSPVDLSHLFQASATTQCHLLQLKMPGGSQCGAGAHPPSRATRCPQLLAPDFTRFAPEGAPK